MTELAAEMEIEYPARVFLLFTECVIWNLVVIIKEFANDSAILGRDISGFER